MSEPDGFSYDEAMARIADLERQLAEAHWPDDFDCGFKHAMEIAILHGVPSSKVAAMQSEPCNPRWKHTLRIQDSRSVHIAEPSTLCQPLASAGKPNESAIGPPRSLEAHAYRRWLAVIAHRATCAWCFCSRASAAIAL